MAPTENRRMLEFFCTNLVIQGSFFMPKLKHKEMILCFQTNF